MPSRRSRPLEHAVTPAVLAEMQTALDGCLRRIDHLERPLCIPALVLLESRESLLAVERRHHDSGTRAGTIRVEQMQREIKDLKSHLARMGVSP